MAGDGMTDWHPDIPQEYRNQIVTGDARRLAEAIPDESIDLIFTDPVYDRIEDYEWLAETAARVLKNTGALLCWSNGKWHRLNTNWLEQVLVYRYDFASVHHAGGSPMYGKIIAKTNRLIWLDKNGESKLSGYIPDGHLSKPWSGPKEFKWTKNPRLTELAIKSFPGLVFDPFTGGGTVPAVCKMLQRNYIAFEIDPTTADLARERVRNTQPPLLVPQAEQSRLDL